MERALATHESEMAAPRSPIPANDIDAEDGEDVFRGRPSAVIQPALRYD